MRYGVEKFRAGTRERAEGRTGPEADSPASPDKWSYRHGKHRRTGTAVPNVRHLGDVCDGLSEAARQQF
jgi:hypothetical protein